MSKSIAFTGMIMSTLDTSLSSNDLDFFVIFINYFFKDNWIIDSGVNAHVTHSLLYFQSYKYINDKIIVSFNQTIIHIVVIGIV